MCVELSVKRNLIDPKRYFELRPKPMKTSLTWGTSPKCFFQIDSSLAKSQSLSLFVKLEKLETGSDITELLDDEINQLAGHIYYLVQLITNSVGFHPVAIKSQALHFFLTCPSYHFKLVSYLPVNLNNNDL